MTSGLAFEPAAAQPVRLTRIRRAAPAQVAASSPQSLAATKVAAQAAAQRDAAAGLRRPRLLIRAARAGQTGWRRERDLPRLLGSAVLPGAAMVLRLLLAEEAFLDGARRQRAGTYSPERHVLVLIALLAELNRATPTAAIGDGPGAGPEVEAGAASAEVVPLFSGPGTARPERL